MKSLTVNTALATFTFDTVIEDDLVLVIVTTRVCDPASCNLADDKLRELQSNCERLANVLGTLTPSRDVKIRD